PTGPHEEDDGDLRPHAGESNGPEGGQDVRHADPHRPAQAPQALTRDRNLLLLPRPENVVSRAPKERRPLYINRAQLAAFVFRVEIYRVVMASIIRGLHMYSATFDSMLFVFFRRPCSWKFWLLLRL
ncbi:unnamed protein product, partial [Ectocarpus sp. 4 AP-2014]